MSSWYFSIILKTDSPLYPFPAHRVGSPKKDKCGQTPWRFIGGPWEGLVVVVEPHKMIRRLQVAPALS